MENHLEFSTSSLHSKLRQAAENDETLILETIKAKYYNNKPSGQWIDENYQIYQPDDLSQILNATISIENNTTNNSDNLPALSGAQNIFSQGQTSLHVAAENGSLNYVKSLFQIFGYKTCKGTDPDLPDDDQWTPFLMAVAGGWTELVTYFLEVTATKYANSSAIRGTENLPAYQRSSASRVSNVSSLISKKDMAGWDALMWACYKGHDEIVELLLQNGADASTKVSYQMNSLMWAAGRGHFNCVNLLLKYKKHSNLDVSLTDRFGSSALYWACRRGCLQSVLYLLKDSNIFSMDQIGAHSMTCLTVAVKNGHTQVALKLLEERKKCIKALAKEKKDKSNLSGVNGSPSNPSQNIKTSLNQPDKDSRTALHYAARLGMTSVVNALGALEVHKNKQDKYGNTALILASKHGKYKTVDALLANYCDIDLTDSMHRSALYWACERAASHLMSQDKKLRDAKRKYLNKKQSKNNKNPRSSRFMEKSVNEKIDSDDHDGSNSDLSTTDDEDNIDYLKVIESLLNHRADTELADKRTGETALLTAVKNRCEPVVSILIRNSNASCKVRDLRGDTALHMAIRSKSKNIVELLLKDPKNEQLLYTPNDKNETPYNIDSRKEPKVLTSIFGHRSLNIDEELTGPNLANYDLYSSALADVLAEPTLQTPLTVGIYAQWGSGKSFLHKLLIERLSVFNFRCTLVGERKKIF